MTNTETTEQTFLEALAEHRQMLWPKDEEHATAEAIIAYATSLASTFLEMVGPDHPLPEVDDVDGRTLHNRTIGAMQGWFQTSFLLQALHEVDRDRADELATDIWHFAEAGDGYGEFLWHWSILRDIPIAPNTLDGEPHAEAKAKAQEFERRSAERRAKAATQKTLDSVAALTESLNKASEPPAIKPLTQ